MSDGSEPTVTQGSVESAASVESVAAPASVAAPVVSLETPRVEAEPVAMPVQAPSPAPTRPPVAPAPAARGGRRTGSWWTLPAIAAGMSVIAAVLIVGQVEENRLISWQRNKLQMDLDYFTQQAKVNQEFLSRLETDVNLAERLAQRQMKLVREGSALLELKETPAQADNSPFRLVRIAPPPEVKPYEPAPGMLSHLLATPRARGFTLGAGAFLVAIGLIMGFSGAEKRP